MYVILPESKQVRVIEGDLYFIDVRADVRDTVEVPNIIETYYEALYSFVNGSG